MGRFVILCFLIVSYEHVVAQTYSDMDRLHKNLTSNYNRNIRPTVNFSSPTHVVVGFQLLSIKEFVEKDNKLSIMGIFILEWNDYNMVWDPGQYGGISTFLIPQKDVWKPDLILGNPYNSIQSLGFDEMHIRVRSDGTMFWMPGDIYESTCAADITNYPFDEHTCYLLFYPWMYLNDQEMTLHNLTSKPETSLYFPSGQWELIDTRIEAGALTVTPEFKLMISFRRRPLFSLINIFVPASVMALLITLVFLLPADSGERVGFSITVLLALTVFLTIVSDSLPNTSEPSIPRMSYILIADLVISTLATICTILGLRLHHKPEESKIPKWLQYFICATQKNNRYSEKDLSDSDYSQIRSREVSGVNYTHPMTSLPSVYCSQNYMVHGRNDQGHHRLYQPTRNKKFTTGDNSEMQHSDRSRYQRKDSSHDDSSEANVVTWKQVASFCDVFCFVFFLILVVVKNIIAFITFMT
ncbi:acetylcholine receptor subunit alpha-type acr-16-like [Ylistrum balloti]|uniref:acetylcholine receptor subunit alpha-type acr-16-like n=1 Tax=Ylistrum balloti TaxID=509963 RepID=UPI002905A53A|nr:acetylcholine receptor subunit alpha-type acr-16-like [Ylistrum balloti]